MFNYEKLIKAYKINSDIISPDISKMIQKEGSLRSGNDVGKNIVLDDLEITYTSLQDYYTTSLPEVYNNLNQLKQKIYLQLPIYNPEILKRNIENIAHLFQKEDLYLTDNLILYGEYKTYSDETKNILYTNLLNSKRSLKIRPYFDLNKFVGPYVASGDTLIDVSGNSYSFFSQYLSYMDNIVLLSKAIKQFIKLDTNLKINQKIVNDKFLDIVSNKNINVMKDKLDYLQNNPNYLESFTDLFNFIKSNLDNVVKYLELNKPAFDQKADAEQLKDNANIYISEELYSIDELVSEQHNYFNKYNDFDLLDKTTKICNKVYKLYIKSNDIVLFEMGSYYNDKIYN